MQFPTTPTLISAAAARVAAHRCPVCLGSGGDEHEKDFGGKHPVIRWERCSSCGGTGERKAVAA